MGNPSEPLKVLISTSASTTFVVGPFGCAAPPLHCISERGGVFYKEKSSSWVDAPTQQLDNSTCSPCAGQELIGRLNTTLGYDAVAIPVEDQNFSLPLPLQLVGIFTGNDSLLGLFGLGMSPTNFTNPSNSRSSTKSFMQQAVNNNQLPSASWAYTAGNQYSQSPLSLTIFNIHEPTAGFDKVNGSLVLGGYDTSRLFPNDASWDFSSDSLHNLEVQITSITSRVGKTSTSLLPSPISTFLDSSFPYIWLPIEACLLFEETFGLTWDSQTELYLINDSLHTTLQKQNPSIVFTLGNATTGSNVNITLPYAAFDLTASAPLVASPTRYFPLKRSSNAAQHQLGRTFFQEAYVIADYGRGNFSVSQCRWTAGAKTLIQMIGLPGQIVANATEADGALLLGTGAGDAKSLVPGAVGGTLGSTALIAIFLLFYLFYIRPRRRKSAPIELEDPAKPPSTIDDPASYTKPELDSHEVRVYEIAADREPIETIVQEQAIYELEGQREAVESDAQERLVLELAAREEVAAELRSDEWDVVELASPIPELEADTESNHTVVPQRGAGNRRRVPLKWRVHFGNLAKPGT